MKRLLFSASIFISCLYPFSTQGQDTFELWYKKPANQWTEALPVGNGRLAAMIFGRTDHERIQLNEETIWAGCNVNDINPGAKSNLKKIQRLLLDEKNAEAYKLTKQHMLGVPPEIRSYQTLGDLFIDWGHKEVIKYRRALNIQSAICTTGFSSNGADYTQTVFASAPDNIIVVRLISSIPGKINVQLRLKRERDASTFARGNRLVMSGQIHDTGQAKLKGPEGKHLRFGAIADVQVIGGRIKSVDTALSIENASEVIIRLTAASDYELKTLDFNRSIDPLKHCDSILFRSSKVSYGMLLKNHQSEYSPLFNRVMLNLDGGVDDTIPTDERLNRLREGASDNDLFAIYFQYGRYLLLSSSRNPAKLPANLQGKWNHHFSAPWESDYHTNINLQMNYWPADVTNISEATDPLLRFMTALLDAGRRCAREMYGAGGWVIHHVTDIYGRTAINADPMWGTSPLAGAWMVLNLYDHYAFTQNPNFFKNGGYLLMKEAAIFIIDFLIEDDQGRLVTAPSMSPENGYYINKDSTVRHVITYAPAIDVQIIHELFNAIKALQKKVNEDPVFIRKLDSVQKRLPPFRINQYGGVQEWIKDYEEQEPGHRHMSQLFGLYPGTSLTKDDSLMNAARMTIEHRLKFGGGHTGWSRAWMINFYARLKDGEQAYNSLEQLLKKSTLPNLFDDHPPFQIDGNFGGTSGIAEMLIQSHNNTIELLPALPLRWSSGKLKGLKARGAFELDLEWKNGELIKAAIKSLAGKECRIAYKDKLVSFKTRKGERILLDANLARITN
jgi:alpha-L-fucosidase 2